MTPTQSKDSVLAESKDRREVIPTDQVKILSLLTPEQRKTLKDLVDSDRVEEAREIIGMILEKLKERGEIEYEEGLRV